VIWRHRGKEIPLDIYHGMPAGWRADEIIALHKQMRGTFPIWDFEIGHWGAPSWMTQRYEWLRYKETLNRISAGIRAGDEVCADLGIRYIELRYIGSYSGYLREKLARALRSVPLTRDQEARLNNHFLSLILAKDYTLEFKEYRKLWGQIISPDVLAKLVAHARKQTGSDTPPPWLAGIMRRHEERMRAGATPLARDRKP
jgi:hypothetical protein